MNKMTVSCCVGKGSIKHNNREFYADNVDREKSRNNICYVKENIRDVYSELFDKALAEYNSKKTKTRDKIPDYYEHIRLSKQEKLFHEVIFQVGNKDTAGIDTPGGEKAKLILDGFMKNFQERNPNLRVFNAVLHLDEVTPHLHIDFIPFCTAQERGLSTRVSMKQALKQMGFTGHSKQLTEWAVWTDREKSVLSDEMKSLGIENEILGGKLKHQSVQAFKLQKQLESLKNEKNLSEDINAVILDERQKLLQQKIDEERNLENIRNQIRLLDQEKKEIEHKLEIQRSEMQKNAEKLEKIADAKEEISEICSQTHEKGSLRRSVTLPKESYYLLKEAAYEAVQAVSEHDAIQETMKYALIAKEKEKNKIQDEKNELEKENKELKFKIDNISAEKEEKTKKINTYLQEILDMRDFITEHNLREQCIEYLDKQKEERNRPKYYYELEPKIDPFDFIVCLKYNKIKYLTQENLYQFYEDDKEKIKEIINTFKLQNAKNNNGPKFI